MSKILSFSTHDEHFTIWEEAILMSYKACVGSGTLQRRNRASAGQERKADFDIHKILRPHTDLLFHRAQKRFLAIVELVLPNHDQRHKQPSAFLNIRKKALQRCKFLSVVPTSIIDVRGCNETCSIWPTTGLRTSAVPILWEETLGICLNVSSKPPCSVLRLTGHLRYQSYLC